MNTTEALRLSLQSKLDQEKTFKERNALGQYATPALLALDVLALAKKIIDPTAPVRFLDPAIGTGAFYAALLDQFGSERIASADGFEIDPHYGDSAITLWAEHRLSIKIADFTRMIPPDLDQRPNLIICNPPYVRHHHLNMGEKCRLSEAAAISSGISIKGLAGLYCYFLLIAHSWLAEDGIAGWLVPSEFMDVNYGVSIKRYLLDKVELLRIHRFDPNELQFGDALVSSAVIWFRKRTPSAEHKTVMSFGGTLATPLHSRSVSRFELERSTKWSSLAQASRRLGHKGLKLSDFFSVKRGIATGDNNFFIMSQEKIDALGIPAKFMKPILPAPRYLESDVVEAGEDGTPLVLRKLFLLDCSIEEDKIKSLYPSLWNYLESGRATAGKTYICEHRTLWYSQEVRPPAPFVCTYMGRALDTRRKPFRFIHNKSQATAANVYLMLYPKPILEKAFREDPTLAIKVWKFLNTIPSEILLGEGRVYGGGLYKMEPKELANVPADDILNLLPLINNRPISQAEFFDEFVA